MVSIIVLLAISIGIGIVIGIIEKSITSCFLTILPCICFSFILVVLGGVYLINENDIVEIKDYETYNVGNGLVYVDDSGRPQELNSDYSIKVDSKIKVPTYREIKYDNTFWIRVSSLMLVIPEDDFKVKKE